MKIEELIHKVYLDEKLPKKIKINDVVFSLIEDYKNYNINFYYEDEYEDYWLDNIKLGAEIEIIEEKEIEELDLGKITPNGEYIISVDGEKIQNKINELVRELNKIKKEGK